MVPLVELGTLRRISNISWLYSLRPALARMGVMTEAAEDLHTTSDHQTLRSTIALQGSPQAGAKGRFRLDTTDPEEFVRSLIGVLPRVETAMFTSRPTLEQLDRLTEEITTAISTALAASTKRATGTVRAPPDMGRVVTVALFRSHVTPRCI